jgi:hypothetical protein
MAFARKYPLELRGTVRLVFESGRPVLEVARDVGTSSIARETALLLSRPSCAAFTATRVATSGDRKVTEFAVPATAACHVELRISRSFLMGPPGFEPGTNGL